MTGFSKTILTVLVLGVLSPFADASTIDAIYAFGDSLTDVGNVYAATGGTIPVAPYVNGEFSNGQVWVQDLAADLGLPAVTPSLLGGTGYAYGSGETAPEPFNLSIAGTDVLGPTGQLAQYQSTHATADPNALYAIWIGSNDLIDITATASPAQFAADVGIVVGNVDTTIGDLAAMGAKNFLVITAPNLGDTPLAASLGVQTTISQLAQGFDTTLVNGAGPIPSLASIATADGLNLQVLDTYSLLDSIVASPSTYGLTDATDPCVVGITECANPNQYLFFDDQHPTAAGQAIIADAALAVLTPEPASISLSLIGIGLLGLVLARRRAIGQAGRRQFVS